MQNCLCKKDDGSSYINQFTQPDSLIPDPSNPQSWNRYSYVKNNPINFNDPTGHKECEDEHGCGAYVPRKPKPKPVVSKDEDDSKKPGGIINDLQGDDAAPLVDTYDPYKLMMDPNLLFDPFANDKWLMNCRNVSAKCIINNRPFIPHWDWSRIDWRRTGIDGIGFIASLANLKWASNGAFKAAGVIANTDSGVNSLRAEIKYRGNLQNALFDDSTVLTIGGYLPVVGPYASGTTLLKDISAGYYEETLPMYGPFMYGPPSP